jgi:hypothetical protein
LQNGLHSFNGVVATASSNRVDIREEWIGQTISIVRGGNGTTTINSEPQILTIPTRPAAPSGFTVVHPTTSANNNGQITGGNNTWQHRRTDLTSWTTFPSSGNAINLIPGAYEIRIRATSTNFFGTSVFVTINPFTDGQGNQEPTPTGTIDFGNEIIQNLVANRTYSINGTNRTADANGRINISTINSAWPNASQQTLTIIRNGNGTTTTNSSSDIEYSSTSSSTKSNGKSTNSNRWKRIDK